MNIKIFSNVCIDHNFTKAGPYTAAGSPAFSFTRILKYFPNVQTTIISSYGKDFLPYLKDISILPNQPNFEKTLIYENDTRRKVRIQKAFNHEISNPPEITDQIQNVITQSDAVIIAPIVSNFSLEYIKEIFKFTQKNCLKILSPQGFFRSITKEHLVVRKEFSKASQIIPLFNYVILSNEDYPDIERISQIWVKDTQTKVIVTLAERGARLITSESTKIIPTTPVKDIVNPVGAGDIFTASFIYKFLKSRDEDKSIHFAHKIAGFCLKFTPDKIKLTDSQIDY